jgi:hypothetical protein
MYSLDGAPWVQAFIGEHAVFPNGQDDGRIDALAQLIVHYSSAINARDKWRVSQQPVILWPIGRRRTLHGWNKTKNRAERKADGSQPAIRRPGAPSEEVRADGLVNAFLGHGTSRDRRTATRHPSDDPQ